MGWDTAGGLEIFCSDCIANEHHDLVNQSADWLEGEMGVLNLGPIDYKILMSDGRLTDELRTVWLPGGLSRWTTWTRGSYPAKSVAYLIITSLRPSQSK